MVVDSPRDSFRSYVRYGDDESAGDDDAGSSFRMLQGELVASQCEDVLLYPPFGDNLFGKLYCTNFRLCFVPLADLVENSPCCSRSAVLEDRFQLALCSIEQILISALPLGPRPRETLKLKPMTGPVSTLEIVSCLKIFTKDFRTLTIDFQKSQFAVNLANQIYHFANPANATQIVQLGLVSRVEMKAPRFNTKSDWERELRRCGVPLDRFWRFSYINSEQSQRFHLVQSYPECVVVPIDLFDHLLASFVCNWNLGRFPIWCWTGRNGCALLRSADASAHSHVCDDLWEEVIEAVARAHPESWRPELLDCHVELERIANAFTRLRELCCSDSLRSFVDVDRDWLTLLDATGWLQLVSECLGHVTTVVNTLILRKRSLIIRGEGCDMTAVVSSLCQICCDRYYRTMEGFETLIEKEWSSLGHPFGRRLFGSQSMGTTRESDSQRVPTTPTFLLFLDCLAQLTRLNPNDFEYSQYFLIAVWDVAICGFSSVFTCNSIRDQVAMGKDDSLFPISQFYSSQYSQLFLNAQYSSMQMLDVLAEQNFAASILFPPNCPLLITLWEECYLRWLQPAHTLNGGGVVRDIAMRELATELVALTRQRLGDRLAKPTRPHPAAELAQFSSAFPFSRPTTVDYSVRSFSNSDLLLSQQHHPASISSRSLLSMPVTRNALVDGDHMSGGESQEARFERLRQRPLPPPPPAPIDPSLFPQLDASPPVTPRLSRGGGTLV